jgi:hypothetical protein
LEITALETTDLFNDCSLYIVIEFNGLLHCMIIEQTNFMTF